VLLSMTGQGVGKAESRWGQIAAEIRSVNNRHLKLQLRVPESLSTFESQIEAAVRNRVRRGSVHLTLKHSGSGNGSGYALQADVLESYVRQCHVVAERLGLDSRVAIGDLLALPGVVVEDNDFETRKIGAGLIDAAIAAVEAAMDCLHSMRAVEGENMRVELRRQLEVIRHQTEAIVRRAPSVVDDYRERLTVKLKRVMAEIDQQPQPTEIVREVLLFAERADIREEIVRLGSHVNQFANLLDAEQSHGRKLDFLTQEMFRETNTIGAKANDAEIAQRVVELKTTIEQIRELVQNVE
jgi:uncharacterized protein (TIGR00255 family)